MPEPVKKEWEEDTTNTALCAVGEAEEDTADELVDEEDLLVNEWGEEDPEGFALPRKDIDE